MPKELPIGAAQFVNLGLRDGRMVLWLGEADVGYIVIGRPWEDYNRFMCLKVRMGTPLAERKLDLVWVVFGDKGWEELPVKVPVDSASFSQATYEVRQESRLGLGDFIGLARAWMAREMRIDSQPPMDWGKLFAHRPRLAELMAVAVVDKAELARVFAEDYRQCAALTETMRTSIFYSGPPVPEHPRDGLRLWLVNFIVMVLLADGRYVW